MVNEVVNLRSRSVRAAIMSSGGKVDKVLVATDDDIAHCRLLFCATEAFQLQSPSFRLEL